MKKIRKHHLQIYQRIKGLLKLFFIKFDYNIIFQILYSFLHIFNFKMIFIANFGYLTLMPAVQFLVQVCCSILFLGSIVLCYLQYTDITNKSAKTSLSIFFCIYFRRGSENWNYSESKYQHCRGLWFSSMIIIINICHSNIIHKDALGEEG